jgi:hypothetical protein
VRGQGTCGAQPGHLLQVAHQVRVPALRQRTQPGMAGKEHPRSVQSVLALSGGRGHRRIRGRGRVRAQGLRFLLDHPPVQGPGVPDRRLWLAGGGAAQAIQRTGRAARRWRLPLEGALRAARPHQELRLLAAVLHRLLPRPEPAGAGRAGKAGPGQIAFQILRATVLRASELAHH